MDEFKYPRIDMKRTGQRLKEECARQNYTVKDILAYLEIGAFQSVYAWFSGKTLPSLDNMYALSRLLGKTMEQLIVCREERARSPKAGRIFEYASQSRVWKYYCRLSDKPVSLQPFRSGQQKFA